MQSVDEVAANLIHRIGLMDGIGDIDFENLITAYKDGRIHILPYKPGTIFQQDDSGEFDITFTGNVLYETVCNEDTEWFSEDEISEDFKEMKLR